MKGFYITYDVVTEESAEYGEVADYGFYDTGGWYYSMNELPLGEVKPPEPALVFYPEFDFDPDEHADESEAAIQWAVERLKDAGATDYSGSGWWSTTEPDIDYATDESTTFSYHPEGFTDDEIKAIAARV